MAMDSESPQAVKLTTKYTFEEGALNQHLQGSIRTANDNFPKSGSKNFLKVGVYFVGGNVWRFCEFDEVWVSGWQKPKNSPLTVISLGDVYVSDNQSSIDELKKQPGGANIIQKLTNEITADFQIRDIAEPFATSGTKSLYQNFYATYCHSEQAFFSSLQREAPSQNINDTLGPILLVFHSTNPPCLSCETTILNMLGNAQLFRQFMIHFISNRSAKIQALNIFPHQDNVSVKSVNVFYAYQEKMEPYIDKLDIQNNNLYIYQARSVPDENPSSHTVFYSQQQK